MKTRLGGSLLLGLVMIAFLCLVVLLTKGLLSALEMLVVGALVVAAGAWYDSL